MRVLGEDCLVFLDRECLVADTDGLLLGTHQAQLDSPCLAVVLGAVREGIELEVGPELPVEMPQHVEIEFGRHTGAVVVCALDDIRVLLEIDTDKQGAAFAGLAVHHAE